MNNVIMHNSLFDNADDINKAHRQITNVQYILESIDEILASEDDVLELTEAMAIDDGCKNSERIRIHCDNCLFHCTMNANIDLSDSSVLEMECPRCKNNLSINEE